MIPRTASLLQTTELTEAQIQTETRSWQAQLSAASLSASALLEQLGLSFEDFADCGVDLQPDFPLRVPASFIDKMRRGDPADPLLLQVLPLGLENQSTPGFSADPLGEGPATAVPGLLHKYRSRALLITSPACAIHCRYCFRRHFPYQDNRPSKANWQAAVSYVTDHTEINEIILSGGDPLAASDRHLDELLSALEAIPHLKRIRWHSRLPVVLPDRICHSWLQRIKQSPLRHYMVIHSNHAQELGQDVAEACSRMRAAGISLLNQTVLLRGINDEADILSALSERLDELGVRPYYLHVLDRVEGAAHFEVSEQHAQQLMAELQTELPGFLVPILVREEAGRDHKTRLPAEPHQS